MIEKIVNGIEVLFTEIPNDVTEQEIEAYVNRGINKYGKLLSSMTIYFDGDYVELYYDFKNEPFQRIRRITGYLVGDKSRWNDAKSSEEEDRVKHGL